MKQLLAALVLILASCNGESPNRIYEYTECQNFSIAIYREGNVASYNYSGRNLENCDEDAKYRLEDYDNHFVLKQFDDSRLRSKSVFDKGMHSYQVYTWNS